LAFEKQICSSFQILFIRKFNMFLINTKNKTHSYSQKKLLYASKSSRKLF
jgi:hypothetical protein